MQNDPTTTEISVLLDRANRGDREALGELMVSLMDELKRRASRALNQNDRAAFCMNTTDLFHAAVQRLFGSYAIPHFQGQAHFLRLCSLKFRQILIDEARKRAGVLMLRLHDPVWAEPDSAPEPGSVSLDKVRRSPPNVDPRVLDVDRALGELERLDPNAAYIAHLRFFIGLTET
jgi:hypothetical protein